MSTAERASIMLSAGEASGDLHGATVCRALHELRGELRLSGMGGVQMAAAGMEVVADPTRDAAVGASEALGRIPRLYRTYRDIVGRLRRERPRALVVIDFPEFNLRLARHAARLGVPVVYFIPPQLWVWRRGRIRQMARRVSRVLAVLPFEEELYRRAGVPVQFVGHPLQDVLPFDLDRAEARRRLGIDSSEGVVALLPGSRREEVSRLLPAMLDAARRLWAAGAARRFVLGLASTIDRGWIDRLLEAGASGDVPAIEVREGRTHEVMVAADVALAASGTATLEAALLGTPMVVCYRVSLLTEVMVRLLTHGRWVSLPNIVAGRAVVPEILQREVTGERLAAEVRRLLEDPRAALDQRAAFEDVRSRLGEPGVGRRAALAVLEVAGVG
jgi:lipid-A-disaccharide synthase